MSEIINENKYWNKCYVICKKCGLFLIDYLNFDYTNHKWKCKCGNADVKIRLKFDFDQQSMKFDPNWWLMKNDN